MGNGNLDPELAGLLTDIDEDISAISDEKKPIPQQTQQKQTPVQVSSNFLKKVTEGVSNEFTSRLIDQLDKSINAPLKEDKALFRQRLISTYWNFLSEVITKLNTNLPIEKLFCIRYGIVDMELLAPVQADIIKKIPVQAGTNINEFPFFYIDEWLKKVANGEIKPSLVDEVAAKQKGGSEQAKEKLDRKNDARNAELIVYKNKADERNLIEKSLLGETNILLEHAAMSEYDNLPDIYNPGQKEIINKITDDLRKLKNIDMEMLGVLRNLKGIDNDIQSLRGKVGEGGPVIDTKIILDEFNSLRQMIKMCVGPRGNHFPILIKDYAPTSLESICTRENIIKIIAEVEKETVMFLPENIGNRKIELYLLL